MRSANLTITIGKGEFVLSPDRVARGRAPLRLLLVQERTHGVRGHSAGLAYAQG
jgi:hypothetical protein